MKPNVFRIHLRGLLRQWQSGLYFATLFRCIELALTVLLVYGFLDFWLGLEVPWRIAATAVCGVVILGMTWRWFAEVARLSLSDMGRRADGLLGTKRQSILSAHELQVEAEQKSGQRPFNEYLVDRAVTEATGKLYKLTPEKNMPFDVVLRRMKYLAIPLLLLIVLACWQTRATRIILARVFQPFTDLAPYSRYEFVLDPVNPQALYGGNVDLAVDILGAPVTGQVWFATRQNGQIERTPCFQESAQRFAQKLENVTDPIEFRFEMGRARSDWQPVAVSMLPHITLARATVTPPAYARRPVKLLFIGQENLSALRGSAVLLSVTSNRPLDRGTLLLRDAKNSSNETVVAGRKTGEHTVSFSWTADKPATAEVIVRDVQGVESPEPLKFTVKITPDEAPSVVITEPPPFLLATPDAVLSFRGYAEDDLGLQRAEFVRAVVGYRDRSRPLDVRATQLRYDFDQELPLKEVGVQPGDVLEFSLEAADLNPSLMGVTASDPVRVQIISTEEYAQQIRTRTTAEEFAARYDLANQKFDAAHNALQELQKKAADKNSTPSQIEESLQEARKKLAEAIQFFEAMQKDFAAYDSDGSLKKSSGEIAEALRNIAKQLDQASTSDPNLPSQAVALSEQLSAPQRKLAEETRKGKEIESVAKLMESAAKLSMLARSQESLVRRIERRGDTGWQYPLEPLAERQEELQKELEQLAGEIPKQADALPDDPEYSELGKSARGAARKIEDLNIAGDMQKGHEAGRNQNRDGADRHGSEALRKLKSLLASCEGTGFGEAGQGKMTFSPKNELRSTLQQMCQGLCNRFGLGKKKGEDPGSGGGGAGGYADDGYWVGNITPLAVPVYGPVRIGLRPSEDSTARGHRASGSAPEAPLLDANAMSQITNAPKDRPHGEALSPEDLPEKYRDSILRYFDSEPQPARTP